MYMFVIFNKKQYVNNIQLRCAQFVAKCRAAPELVKTAHETAEHDNSKK